MTLHIHMWILSVQSVETPSWLLKAEMRCPEEYATNSNSLTWPKWHRECLKGVNNTLIHSALTMDFIMRHLLRHFKSLITPEKALSQNWILQSHIPKWLVTDEEVVIKKTNKQNLHPPSSNYHNNKLNYPTNSQIITVSPPTPEWELLGGDWEKGLPS